MQVKVLLEDLAARHTGDMQTLLAYHRGRSGTQAERDTAGPGFEDVVRDLSPCFWPKSLAHRGFKKIPMEPSGF